MFDKTPADATLDSPAYPTPTPSEGAQGSGSPSTSAAVAGGRGQQSECWCEYPVVGIAPHSGWSLWAYEEHEPDDRRISYSAHRAGECRTVHVSRSFTPTTERFAFLVERDFPRCPPKPKGNPPGIRGPWFDDEIDAAIALQVAA